MKRLLLLGLGWLSFVPVYAEIDQPVDLIRQETPGVWEFEWPGIPGRTYFLRHSDDLTVWTFYPDVIEQGEGLPIAWGFMNGSPENADSLFLQLKYTDVPAADPEMADFDGDGVATIFELTLEILGTDPLEFDTDGDGIPDGGVDSDMDGMPDDLEIFFFGSDLTAQAGSDDSDMDGLTNAEELELTMDPTINESASASLRANYTYDLNGRLTGAASPQGATTFLHDEEGNIEDAQ